MTFGGTLNRPVYSLPCEVAYIRERMDDKSTTENKTKARGRYRGRWERSPQSHNATRYRLSSVHFLSLSFFFSLLLSLFLSPSSSLLLRHSRSTHVFSSCLPIENRVGDQIEFPTSTSFYSLRAGRSRVGWGKNLTGFSAFEMRAFEKAK